MKKGILSLFAGATVMGVLFCNAAAVAADWKLAMPTASGLAFIDPAMTGKTAVTLSGMEFGQIDEVISVEDGARLLASISSVGSGQETMLAYDTRLMAPTGTTSFGSAIFGIIPEQTVVLPDGKNVVITSFDGNVNVLEIATGKAVGKPVALEVSPIGTALNGDNSILVVASREDLEVDSALSLHTLSINPVASLKNIPLGKVKLNEEIEVKFSMQVVGDIAAVYAPGTAFLTNLKTGKVTKLAPVYNKKVLDPFGLSADGKKLLCRYGDGKYGIFVADAATGKVTKRVLMRDPVFSVGSGDGSLTYVASVEKGTLGVFDKGMKCVASYLIPDLLRSVKVLASPAQSALPIPKTIGGNIVVLGDALLGADAKDTFATALARLLSAEGYGIPIINSSSTDAESMSFPEDFEGNVTDYNAKIVIIEMGQADLTMAQADAIAELAEDVKADEKAAAIAAAQKVASEKVGPQLNMTIEKALAAGLKVIIISPPSDLLKPAYDAAAAKYSVTHIPGGKAFKNCLDAAYPAIKELVAGMAK